MSKIVTYDRDYVYELISNSYNISGATIVPFTGNYKTIANKISVNKNVFFGDLTINMRSFLLKNANVFNNAFSGDLFSSFQGNPQLYLAGNIYPPTYAGVTTFSNTDLIHYPNLLFDDLKLVTIASWLTKPLEGSLTDPYINAISISQLTPGGMKTYINAFWLGILASNPSFIFMPEFLYFSGYLVNINI